jgi:subfamily B ATP-binding cassette protein MsbA
LVALLSAVLILLSAIFEGLSLAVINLFLEGITTPDKAVIKFGIDWIDVWIIGAKSDPTDRVMRLGLLVILFSWLRSLFAYLGPIYAKLTEAAFADRLRRSIFEQLISLSLSYYSQTRSGDLVNCLTNEITIVQRGFGAVLGFAIRGSTLFIYIFSMFFISWQLSIASLVLFAMLSVFMSQFIVRVREASFPFSKANSDFTSTSIELISSIRTVQTFSTQDFERLRFNKVSEAAKKASFAISKAISINRPLAEAIASTILISVVVTGFNLFVINGQLQAASLLTFMFILFRMMPLVEQVNSIRVELGSYGGAIVKIKQLLETEDKPYLADGFTELKSFERAIEFINVDFGYNNLEETVLKGINLSIECGKTTALVGTSGAGKTTLADLIPRLYDPSNGAILMDGIDLKDLTINSLRRRMAVVSQSTFIFNASVRYNISYGLDDVSEQLIEAAARQANALEFIQDMSEGFDTVLGDRGVRLSGGQCQRIAIARALLRKPEILILDEATSALDSVTERLIQESLDDLAKGCTVIVIAHRLSTIVRADKVVVLEKGQIIEQGTYQELIALKGALWKYHQIQNSDAT